MRRSLLAARIASLTGAVLTIAAPVAAQQRIIDALSFLLTNRSIVTGDFARDEQAALSTRDTIIRAYMAGAILALAAGFAVTISVNTKEPLLGALLFPVGFSMLYLLGFDLLTGVFVLCPLALIDKRPGVTLGGVLRNWGLVFLGNFAGAFTVAVMMAIVFVKRR